MRASFHLFHAFGAGWAREGEGEARRVVSSPRSGLDGWERERCQHGAYARVTAARAEERASTHPRADTTVCGRVCARFPVQQSEGGMGEVYQSGMGVRSRSYSFREKARRGAWKLFSSHRRVLVSNR